MSTTDTLLAQAAPPAAGAVRPGTAVDDVDGVRPRIVAEPGSRAEVAELLAWAATEHLTVVVRGGGTKQTWGSPPASVDLLLSTARLNQVIAHRDGDLTATIEAGATLASVNQALGARRQRLPLDPAWSSRATIGGLVATNDSGPSRHRHGAPRDLIIGVTLARPDGALAKAGGIVVKNVAGYDLSRLMTGSFGSLGVIVDATFKLSPVAPASATVVVDLDALDALGQATASLMASPLTPTILELAHPPTRLLLTFESIESAVEQQAREAVCILGATGRARVTTGDEERAVREDHAAWWDHHGTLLKMSTLTTALIPTLAWVSEQCAGQGVTLAVQGRAGLGVVDVRLEGSVVAQARVIADLRARFSPATGSVVVRRADRALREAVEPWGPLGDAQPVMQEIKRRFDPEGRLNPGRGPV